MSHRLKTLEFNTFDENKKRYIVYTAERLLKGVIMSKEVSLKIANKRELAIYKNYRAALRAGRNTQIRSSIARQEALKVTSARYHIPISEVKKITRYYDDIFGIKHEHSEKYLKELKIQDIVEEASKEWAGQPAICQSCGITNSSSDTIVRIRINERASGLTDSLTDSLVDRVEDPSKIVLSMKCFKHWFYEDSTSSQ